MSDVITSRSSRVLIVKCFNFIVRPLRGVHVDGTHSHRRHRSVFVRTVGRGRKRIVQNSIARRLYPRLGTRAIGICVFEITRGVGPFRGEEVDEEEEKEEERCRTAGDGGGGSCRHDGSS